MAPPNENARAGELRANADGQKLQSYTATNSCSLQGRIRRHGKSIIGDCPLCGYKGALSITEQNGRQLYYCHAGCPQADLWAVVRDPNIAIQRQHDCQDAQPADKGVQDYIRQLWQSSRPAKDTAIATYLNARGIVTDIPQSIRILLRHKHRPTETFWSVMLAAVTYHDGVLRALHRTFLAVDGKSKAPVDPERMTLGPVMGCSVHLGEIGERIAISEGLETGLSVMVATGIPTWAALSAGGIEQLILPPLPLAREVIIAADNDANGRGQRAAEAAAMRWYSEGRDVRIATPPHTGKDFNDLLQEVSHE